jgi:hypothetical protein
LPYRIDTDPVPETLDPLVRSTGWGPVPVFLERFSLGVFIGAATVSLFQLETWWAASLSFTAFVLFLLLRWVAPPARPVGRPVHIDELLTARGRGSPHELP